MQAKENNEGGQGAEMETSNQRKRSKGKLCMQGRRVGRRLLRQRINGKLKVLQELIPNCSKRGQVSILDDAVKYIQNLQLQLQMMMSMRAVWSTLQPPMAMMPQPVQSEIQIPSFAPFLQTPMGGIGNMKYEIGTLQPPTAQPEMQIPSPTPFLQIPIGSGEMKYEVETLWPPTAMMPQPEQPEMEIPSLAPFLQTPTESTGEMKCDITRTPPDIFSSSHFPMELPNSPSLPQPPPISHQMEQCYPMMRGGLTATVLPTQIVLPHDVSRPSESSEWYSSSDTE